MNGLSNLKTLSQVQRNAVHGKLMRLANRFDKEQSTVSPRENRHWQMRFARNRCWSIAQWMRDNLVM